MTNMSEHHDVIVVGGGTAGVVAAVQAGRAGARTLLVEKTGMLGGTTTTGGVNFPGLFHAWGRQIIAGIGWELVTRCVAQTGGTLPDFADYRRPHWQLQIRVNPFVYAALCDEAVVDAGVDLLLHTMLADVRPRTGESGWQVTLCTKNGLTEQTAAVVIDATGDANAAALAGLPLHIPEETQPATLSCRAGGYDPADLDIDAIDRAFDAEVKAGRLSYTDASWNTAGPDVSRWLDARGANANHTHQINARTSEDKTRLELESRRSLLRLYRFLRRQPGLEGLVIEQVSPECGVRETATIRGKGRVTVQDYQSGRLWEDAVCYSFYPIDLHRSSGGGLQKEPLAEGTVPTIPRGALLPADSRNFLVAGRCISSDRLANSALRVQATCMATGQAAGALAALSASTGGDPEQLPIADVRTLLRQHGAIVPGDACVPRRVRRQEGSMKGRLKYRPLPIRRGREEIERILVNGTREDLLLLPLSVGEYFPDWQYAQTLCLQMAESEDAEIRANACLGLAYIARTRGRLDRRLVEPVLLRELESGANARSRIRDAIEDIDLYLGWNLSGGHGNANAGDP